MADRTPPASRNAGEFVSSIDWNELPRGEIARDEITADSAGTTTTESILSETVTDMPPDRQIQVFANVGMRKTALGGVQLRLNMDGVQIQRKNNIVDADPADVTLFAFATVQPSSGTHSFVTITGVSGIGGGTATAQASTDAPCVMVVNDVGPAYT